MNEGMAGLKTTPCRCRSFDNVRIEIKRVNLKYPFSLLFPLSSQTYSSLGSDRHQLVRNRTRYHYCKRRKAVPVALKFRIVSGFCTKSAYSPKNFDLVASPIMMDCMVIMSLSRMPHQHAFPIFWKRQNTV